MNTPHRVSGSRTTPRVRTNHVPAHQLHKHSGNFFVKLDGKPHYLGKHDTAESREHYNQLINRWFAAGRDTVAMTVQIAVAAGPAGPTIGSILRRATLATQADRRNFGARRFS